MTDSVCCVCNEGVYEDDEIRHMTGITSRGNNSKVKNGDIICETCHDENMCHRCGEYIEYPNACWACISCQRRIGVGDCNCMAVGWCQSADVICRDCIIFQPEDEWRCEECNVDMRAMLQSGPGIVPDATPKMLCYTCEIDDAGSTCTLSYT